MKSRQRRYFAGRAPCAEGPSDEESDSSKSDRSVSKKAQNSLSTARGTDTPAKSVRRRPRIEAKVLSTGESAAVREDKSKAQRAKSKVLSAFVPAGDKEDASIDNVNAVGRVAEESSSGETSSSYDSESAPSSESASDESRERSPVRDQTPPHAAPPQAPLFIPRAARSAIGDSVSAREATENEAEHRREVQRDEREREARANILSAARKRDETDYDLQRVDMDLFPDDTDRPEDQEMEFELWRVRELKRIMRERGLNVDETGSA